MPVLPHVNELDLKALAREIACRLAPDGLLDAVDVASLLKCEPRTVTEVYARSPGFPKAIRLVGPTGTRGHPRWQRRDVVAWIEAHKQDARKPGRPRKMPPLG